MGYVVIPGINKDDYLDDVNLISLLYCFLGNCFNYCSNLTFLNIYRTVNKGITTFMNYFEEFLNLITYKQNKN